MYRGFMSSKCKKSRFLSSFQPSWCKVTLFPSGNPITKSNSKTMTGEVALHDEKISSSHTFNPRRIIKKLCHLNLYSKGLS